MVVRRRTHDRTGTPADLLVVGLGNPGDDYAQTPQRRLLGCRRTGPPPRRAAPARQTRARRERRSAHWRQLVAVARPTTFYNEAGRAVSALVKRHGIDEFSRLVMVHDELDLEVGRMKLKFGGGLAGNNGLKSVRSHLRTDDFSRLRIGIGKPEQGTMAGRDYVLKRPSAPTVPCSRRSWPTPPTPSSISPSAISRRR